MSSSSKSDGPLEDRAHRSQIRRDKRSGLEFVKLLVPQLAPAALDRARQVRLKPGDPARAVLGG